MDLSSLPNNLETITLNEQTNYRLIEIDKIKDYFDEEIKNQQSLVKKLSKYIIDFDYTDKILTVSFYCFQQNKHIFPCQNKEKIIKIDHFCIFFSLLFKLWNS